tara:strand:- start:1206 stop:1766 length:561 start_codon:yes stop_codon:yes gene_type:complete
MDYKLKQVGDPNKMNGKREIIVYKIYKNGKHVGNARYRPTFYKSKYSVEMDVFKMPKQASDWYKNQGQEYRGKNYSGEPRSVLPAGHSAKNPTAVLKQFKSRWESRIESLKDRAKTRKKYIAKKKRSGLSDSDYEKLGKLTERIKQYQDDTKKRLRSIKSEKSWVVSNKKWITKWKKEITDLKRRK